MERLIDSFIISVIGPNGSGKSTIINTIVLISIILTNT